MDMDHVGKQGLSGADALEGSLGKQQAQEVGSECSK